MRAPVTMSPFEKVSAGVRVGWSSFPLWKYSGVSAEKGLGRFFNHPDLKQIFCSEELLIACLMPIGWAHTGNYQLAPKGGSRRIAEFLARACHSHGARVHKNVRVGEVITESGKCIGVRVRRSGDCETVRVKSRYVVCCSDLSNLLDTLLPKSDKGRVLERKLEQAELYDSAVTISLGLDVPASKLGFDDGLTLLSDPGRSRIEYRQGDPSTALITALSSSESDNKIGRAHV